MKCEKCDEGAISMFDLKDGMYGVCVTKEEFDTEALDKTFEMGRRIEESVRKCDKEREEIYSHILGACIVGLILTALFFL